MSTLSQSKRSKVHASSNSLGKTRSSQMTVRKKERWTGYLSLLPALALVSVLMWYPLATTVYHSFTEWDGLNAAWVGLSNYIDIFTNGDLWLLLRNNLIILLSLPGILFIVLIISILLFEEIPGWKFFRSVYYLPTILSAVVVGFLIKTFFAADGVINELLRTVGLGGLAQTWFDAVPTSFMVIILAFYWQTLGQGVLILLSSLSAISTDLLEAARIDGANWWQRLFRVIFPLLAPAISYFLVTNIIYVFIGLFSLVYSITRGGPGYETTPIDYMIYLKAFDTGDLGYACALAILLLSLVSFISWFQIRSLDAISADA